MNFLPVARTMPRLVLHKEFQLCELGFMRVEIEPAYTVARANRALLMWVLDTPSCPQSLPTLAPAAGFVRYMLSAGRGGFGLSGNECIRPSFYVMVYTHDKSDGDEGGEQGV